MNRFQWSFMQTPTEDMLRKKTCHTCHANFTKFNKVICKVLHLSQDTHQYQCRLRDEWIERSPLEKDLEITGERKSFHDLAMCTGSPEGVIYWATQKKKVWPASQGGWSWSFYSAIVRHHHQYYVQLWKTWMCWKTESHKNIESSGVLLFWRKAEKGEIV